MQRVQITLTDDEARMLNIHAMHQGFQLKSYIKHLIEKVVGEHNEKKKYPVYTLNKKAERIADKGYEDYKEGKARRIHTSFSEIIE